MKSLRISHPLIELGYCSHHNSLFHTSSHIKMKAARVTEWGSPPKYIDIPNLEHPTPSQLQLKVMAAGVARAVRGRAARQHPKFYNEPLPFDPSVDGVGMDGRTGDLYFISSLAAPLFAEYANVEKDQLLELESGADPVAVAALANPTASSWMALQCRAAGGCKGKTVVILGATSASGQAGVSVARGLGATRVVGIARNETKLAAVEGLDDRIVLQSPLQVPAEIGPVDIILDWVGGPAAIELLQTVQAPEAAGENFEYIQCGGLGGEETLEVPMRLLNVKPIKIMASGVGSLTKEEITREMKGLVGVISSMTPPFEVLTAKMGDVEDVWESDAAHNKRLVIVP